MGEKINLDSGANESRQVAYPTQTSRYDEVNAWLVAGNLLCGFLFVVLMLVWIFAERPFDRTSVIIGPSKHLKAQNESQLAEGEVDFPDTTKVAFERMQEALPRLEKIIADLGNRKASDGRGEDGKGGIGGGGDRRLPDDIPPTVPPHQRWQIRYSVNHMDEYRKQLDFFKIEIGVVYSEQNKIVRVSQLSTRPRQIDSTREAENEKKSLYFVHKNSRLKRWDQAIARAAGASLKDAFTVEFFSSELRSQLAELEWLAVRQMGKSLDEVAKTEFRIEEVDGEYKFVVHNVSYR